MTVDSSNANAAASTSDPSHASAVAPVDGPPIAAVESDRYCDQCGYNLRTRPVFRDTRTALLLVRCPECGRYHSAQELAKSYRPWVQRWAVLTAIAWLTLIVGIVCGSLALSGVFPYATLDEFTSHQPYTWSPNQPNTPATWRLEVRDEMRHAGLFLGLMLGSSALLWIFLCAFLSVAAHHWRRAAFLVPAIVLPLIPALVVAGIWREEAPHLFDWGRRWIVLHAATQIAGGVIGAIFGRAAVRLISTLLLPPRLRAVLAFLWFADGLRPPAGESARPD